MDLERTRIFRLIEKGDNFIKYASPGREDRARERAKARYERALELAEVKGDQVLIEQIGLRLGDLSTETLTRTNAGGDGAVESKPGPPATTDRAVEAVPASPRARRVPPGQRVTRGWPVLHEGPIPAFDKQSWRLGFQGACVEPYALSYEELKALPNVELRSDFHCVTGWSKLDNVWRGVEARLLAQKARPAPDATHVLVQGANAYTANLPLDVLMQDDTLVTWSHNGQDLAPEHGFPLRLLVPHLYGWKSVKWVRAFEFLTHDERGYWERRGYHNRADPWREERYSYQES